MRCEGVQHLARCVEPCTVDLLELGECPELWPKKEACVGGSNSTLGSHDYGGWESMNVVRTEGLPISHKQRVTKTELFSCSSYFRCVSVRGQSEHHDLWIIL